MNYIKLLKLLVMVVVLWPCMMLGGIEVIPQGSLVIPMDNVNQAIVPAGQASFNLKAYGLVNLFLQNGIPVRWAIRAGKGINDVDFSALVQRIAPTTSSGGLIDFRGGPFIVPDTILPCGLSTRQIIQSFANNVVVYELASASMIDIKYTITHHPKIAVFNNGGNELIHAKILDAAGIKDYVIMDAADIANLKNCFTFASEPHAEPDEVSLDVIMGVKEFVMNGGNFLAQCHAIDTYENRGFFHTTSGITTVNADISHKYAFADHLFCQINGFLQENEGGSIGNWTLKNGSSWKANTYKTVSYMGSDTVVAMEAHLTSNATLGGNVYYLGGHDYAKGGGKANPTPDLSNISKVNALRMYLNAVFVPSNNSNGAWANAGVPDLQVGCSDSVTLGCTQTGPIGATFIWTPATGLSCSTCPNPIARPTVTTTYKVQVTNGCIATDTVRVVVGPKPISQYTNTTECQGNATRFTDKSTSANFWNWNFGDPESGNNNTSTLQHPSHVFSKSGTFKVTLISGTGINCADTLISTVIVKPIPLLSANTPYICEGDSTTLKAEGAMSYQWSTGNNTETIRVAPKVTSTYTVSGTTAGCTSSLNVIIKVAPTLIPNLYAEPVSCYGGNNGSALATVSGGKPQYTYVWNTSPVQTTAKAIGLKKGLYAVTITDSIGCKAIAPIQVSEPDSIILNTIVKHVSCPKAMDGTAEVSALGGNAPYTFEWNTQPKQQTSKLQGIGAGIYQITVIDVKACTAKVEVSVKEPQKPILLLSSTDVKCFGGSDGTASVHDIPANYTFEWNSSPVQTTATASSLPKGTYTLSLKDTNACIYKDSVTVREPSPIMVTTTTIAPSCIENGEATAVPSGGKGGYIFKWFTSPLQSSATAINISPGTYKLQVMDSSGCFKDTSITLPAPIPPIADFDFDKVCMGSSPTQFWDRSGIPITSAGFSTRIWDFGNSGSTSDTTTSPNPSYNYPNSGIYNVSLIVVTKQGCADTIVKPIEVYPLPVVKFESKGEGCGTVCLELKDSSSVSKGSIYSWLWDFGDGQSSSKQNPSYCYHNDGAYDISLKVITDQGCTATKKLTETVKVYPNPQINLGPTIKVCYEGENTLKATLDAGLASKYLWQPTGETTRFITAKELGIYTLTVHNQWNCHTTAAVEVKQICPPSLYISNAFSPNKDGTNDLYTVYSNHVGKYQMLIFNRWGEIIFESRDKNHFWDGIYRDEPMPVGVYAWIITYEGDSEEYKGPYKKEGSVTVVR